MKINELLISTQQENNKFAIRTLEYSVQPEEGFNVPVLNLVSSDGHSIIIFAGKIANKINEQLLTAAQDNNSSVKLVSPNPYSTPRMGLSRTRNIKSN